MFEVSYNQATKQWQVLRSNRVIGTFENRSDAADFAYAEDACETMAIYNEFG